MNERNLVGLGQISWLRDKMLKSEHFKMYDLNYSDFKAIWETKTKRQYGYFLFLWEKQHYIKLKQFMEQFGFNP